MIEKIKRVIKSCQTEKHMYTALVFAKLVIHRIEERNDLIYFASKHWPEIEEAFNQRIHELKAQRVSCRIFKKCSLM